MQLTDIERILLINQYEILRALNPQQEKYYAVLAKCLTDGYIKEFETEAAHLEPEINDEIRLEVRKIFEMFRALTPNGGSLGILKFAGFDGNEEPQHCAYASFLLQDLDLWHESQDSDPNSHSLMLPAYRKMLKIWDHCADQRNPTAQEINSIAEVAPFLSKRQ